MNLRFVEAFIWVARLQSITRAAEKLCLTQSAVSSRISSLEDELGVPLLDRRDRHFRLTHAGSRFLVYAHRLIDIQHELKAEIGTPEPQSITLRLGAIETVLHTWLIPLIDDLRASKPHIKFELTVEMTPMVAEQLRRGSIDLAFAAIPVQAEGIRSEAIPSQEMVFVGRREAVEGRRWTLEDITRHEVLTFQRGSQPHVALVNKIRTAGLETTRIHTVSSISALIRLVEGGLGFATLPQEVATRLCAKSRAFAILDSDVRLAPLPLHASYWLNPGVPQLDLAVRDAIAFVREHALG